MQFGIGILGKNYDPAENLAYLLASTRPAGLKFAAHVWKYAGKLAADTILAEPPTLPDLTDDGLVRQFATCARPVHRSEVGMVRDAFTRTYFRGVTE